MLILSIHGKPAQVRDTLKAISANVGSTPLSELAGIKIVCAWCGKEIKQGALPASHGICENCARKMEENMHPLVVSMPGDSATAWRKAIYHVDPCARYRLDELVACPHDKEDFLFVHPADANLAAWYEGGRLYLSISP